MSTGARVSATFNVATGPNSQVTGASTTPAASTEVFERRLTPTGWCRTVVKNRLWPWVIAYAGHCRYQIIVAASPHPQVVVDVGWLDQTFDQMNSESAA